MKLYLKQKLFSLGDKFTVYDADGNDKYYVQAEIFSFGKKLHIYDLNGKELAFIKQKTFSWVPTFFIEVGGKYVASVFQRFSFIGSKFEVTNFGWLVEGDFLAHDYHISYGDKSVASIYKEWNFFGYDAYAIDYSDGVRELDVLAVALIIDTVLANHNNSSNG